MDYYRAFLMNATVDVKQPVPEKLELAEKKEEKEKEKERVAKAKV
jgi:hypothetical protein